MENTSRARAAADRLGQIATSAVSTGAGTVVDPKTGLTQLTTLLRKPATLTVIAAAGLAFLAGRRRASERAVNLS